MTPSFRKRCSTHRPQALAEPTAGVDTEAADAEKQTTPGPLPRLVSMPCDEAVAVDSAPPLTSRESSTPTGIRGGRSPDRRRPSSPDEGRRPPTDPTDSAGPAPGCN